MNKENNTEKRIVKLKTGYCPNESCEVFNEYQGDWGKENEKVLKCDFCESELKQRKREVLKNE